MLREARRGRIDSVGGLKDSQPRTPSPASPVPGRRLEQRPPHPGGATGEPSAGGSAEAPALQDLEGISAIEQDASKGLHGRQIVVLGVVVSRLLPTPKVQLAALGTTTVLASVSFAALQERVLYVPGFHYTGWMALLTSLTYVVCAYTDRWLSGAQPRIGAMRDYVKLSAMTMSGMYLTNFSLRYLSYPLRVVFKSSKLIPVMLLSVLYLRKAYTVAQYVSVSLLTVGVVVFTLGDAKGRAAFDARGILAVLLGSLAEALAANFEEKRLFNQLGCSAPEVLLYSGILGSIWAAVADLLTGDLGPAFQHSLQNPAVLRYSATAAVAGYVATSCVLVLIRHYGATAAEIVKSCRKVFTICISFLLYGKQLTLPHIAGVLFFVASVSVEHAAAGSASARRFAGLFFGGSVLATLWLLFLAPHPTALRVVIDAGTIGTRLHIFRFDAWTSGLMNINGSSQVYMDLRNAAVGDYAENVSKLGEVLGPLLDKVTAAVPLERRSSTPISVRATAGLRLLPEGKAREVLGEVRRLFERRGFPDVNALLMKGEEEAEYVWLTFNWLMGTLGTDIQSLKDRVAVLDLGGGSMQVAHHIRDADAKSARVHKHGHYIGALQLPLGNGNVQLYRHSYLGHGQLAARSKALEEWDAAGLGDGNPCLPSGARVLLRAFGREQHAVGNTSEAGCRRLALFILHREQACEDDTQWCAFAGAWRGPPTEGQRLVLSSYFYARMADAGWVGKGQDEATLRPSDWEAASSRACDAAAGGLDSLVELYRELDLETATWMCFDLMYQVALLREGFGIASDREVTVVRRIATRRGQLYEASWALGLSIKQLRG